MAAKFNEDKPISSFFWWGIARDSGRTQMSSQDPCTKIVCQNRHHWLLPTKSKFCLKTFPQQSVGNLSRYLLRHNLAKPRQNSHGPRNYGPRVNLRHCLTCKKTGVLWLRCSCCSGIAHSTLMCTWGQCFDWSTPFPNTKFDILGKFPFPQTMTPSEQNLRNFRQMLQLPPVHGDGIVQSTCRTGCSPRFWLLRLATRVFVSGSNQQSPDLRPERLDADPESIVILWMTH